MRETEVITTEPARDAAVQPEPRSRSSQRAPRGWRQMIVNPRYQLRLSFSIVALALFLLAALNVIVLMSYFDWWEQTDALLLMVASFFFLVGLFGIAIKASHRTAGAAYNLTRCLGRVTQGNYNVVARLRSKDNLHHIEGAFNEMMGTLNVRTHQEIEILRRLVVCARRNPSDPLASELAAGLEGLIEGKKRLLQTDEASPETDQACGPMSD